jgi:hypothetical protein
MDNLYINIGTKKSCLFVTLSMLLIKQLDKNPFLYYAVEEALECAKNNYYASGILAFSQLLNLFNEKTPKDRHIIAHEILRHRPTKEMYEQIIEKVKNASIAINVREMKRHDDIKKYEQKILKAWNDLMSKLTSGWKEIQL